MTDYDNAIPPYTTNSLLWTRKPSSQR